jgi:hypothetical protein
MTALHDLWQHLQRQLFPLLLDEVGPLGEKDHQFVQVVSLLPLGRLLDRYDWSGIGRPPHERIWILHAFIAKAVYGLATTIALIEWLKVNVTLRRLCGWESAGDVPSESTFSRAFAQFADDELPQLIQAQLIATHCGPKLVGHVSRDTTAIEAREHPAPKPPVEPAVPTPPRQRGRPKKGEVRPPKPPGKVEAQLGRSLAENLAALPRACDIGCKTNSKGKTDWWTGYKLHCDTIDGDIPISALLTSASANDMLGAIPLAQMSVQRVRSLYDLMDAGYDAEPIREFSRRLGHVPIIDQNSQRRHERPLDPAERARFRERTAAERVNSRLKEEFGGRTVRVRGAQKVMAHLMFGLLAIAALGIWARLC